MPLSRIVIGLALAIGSSHALAASPTLPVPASGVIGTDDAMFSPDYWIARAPSPDKVIFSRGDLQARNARMFANDPSMYVLAKIPAQVSGEQVKAWIGKVSKLPSSPLLDIHNKPLPASVVDPIVASIALEKIPAHVTARYGLSVARQSLRNFPTDLRAFTTPDQPDFESFQESMLFPGDPVVIVHESEDGQWYFVVSPRYAAWVKKSAIAVGTRDQVLDYAEKTPYRVVTGAKVRTVFTPEAPAVSELQLDMGARVPLANLPPEQPVNGQGAYVSWTLLLPVRSEDGSLKFQPALLQRNADSAPDYVPLTQANIIRQAFKFLGERYGWGHLYNGRDCSGFVSDVYRSLGVQMPRNTGDQAKSPELAHLPFTAADSHEARMKAIGQAQVGDLIYIPGHVMMFLGRVNGEPYVIQDVGGVVYLDAKGKKHWTRTNEVSVTPLLPLLVDEKLSYVDAMTSLVHIRP
ncbi:SH3 domain-containing protein [Pinirhizobacter sp.]|jgi:cell wall-associated NlpC family hydrolase|uniref:C40 family peptidase n=1 Tax=Pinirhizobacter sp. TaxID=2950432 RepID=UPI002F3E5C17